MTRQHVLDVVQKHFHKSVPSAPAELDPSKRFTDYGANSLDVVEIVSGSMRELKVKIPRNELADIQNIDGLLDKLIQKQQDS
jgi:acyl carrier protein